MVRQRLTEAIFEPMVRYLGSDQPERRAALIGVQVCGLVLARHVVALPALAEVPDDVLAADLAPIFQRLLVGHIV